MCSAHNKLSVPDTFNGSQLVSKFQKFPRLPPDSYRFKAHIMVKVYMLAGENDFYRPKQQELIQVFDKTGIKYVYKVVPDMGHEFPENYDRILKESLKYLMTL